MTSLSESLPATKVAQDAGNQTLADILSKISADPASQTTLAAVLDKLPPSPATATKQDAIIAALTDVIAGLASVDGHVDGLEASSASILAKLSSDPATNSKLEAVRALLAATLIVNQVGFDSEGVALPAGFDTFAKNVTQTWDVTTSLPLVRTEVVTVGGNTYTRTTTNTLTGSNITATAISRWVKA